MILKSANSAWFAPWLALFLTLCGYAGAAPKKETPPPVRTPKEVKVNKTVPQVAPPSLTLQFSGQPSDDEIFRARIFEEPLVPCGGKTFLEENTALAKALLAFSRRTNAEDFSTIVGFLDHHEKSRWRTALLLNLGLQYYQAAYYSKALAAWDEAWRMGQGEQVPKGKALADRALGELIRMNAKLGRFNRLEELFREIDGRVILGSATEMIAGAREALWSMHNEPGTSFRCGPRALDRIRVSQDARNAVSKIIEDSRSSKKGMSLRQVWQLSEDLKMNYQMAHRTPGAKMILPSVVHWKLDHFAALIREEKGKYLAKDPTFGNEVWLSQAALENEASGYFLVPKSALPAGWRNVGDTEADGIWGKGISKHNDDDMTTPGDTGRGGNPPTCGMATYRIHLMVVSLNINDIPVGYTPPRGPSVFFTATYSQREARQPVNFNYSNLGSKWTFSWLSYITDTPASPFANVLYYVEGGGTETYRDFNPVTQTFGVHWRNQTLLVRTSTNSYEMRFPDGSKKIFDRPDNSAGGTRKVFLKHVIDSAGNAVELHYDPDFRLLAISDAIGQVTTFSYDLAHDPRKITKVTDPFQRFATFEYDAFSRLSRITDVIGLASEFKYGPGDFINTMITPYGTNRFAFGETVEKQGQIITNRVRWLEATDPQGDTERVEFNEIPNTVPHSEPGGALPAGMFANNAFLYARNSFYWDKKAMKEAPGQYGQADLTHWVKDGAVPDCVTGAPQCIKSPSGNRVWFNYPNQPLGPLTGSSDLPEKIGRVLDDGTTQLYQYERNSLGKVTKSIDPIGRTFSYFYADNEIDLLEVRQTRGNNYELLAHYTYNSQHLPLTATDASGQTTRSTYNSYGQVTSIVNALNQTNTLTYDAEGYLLSIDGALPGTNDSTTFTYDAFGRVRTVTDSEGYTIATDYDALDRPTRMTYPDGTFRETIYNKLDAETMRDRLGRLTHRRHNSIRQLVENEDALHRITRFDWCDCGSLSSITDALGRITRFHYDIQGRLKTKEYVDGSRIEYTYEATTDRLKSIRDEKGQIKNYEYFPDDNLKRISYVNAEHPTPTVSFTYDTNYNRVLLMQDGTGITTFRYHPISFFPHLGAGRLASEDAPLLNDTITYRYDELGQVVERAIGGVSSKMAYDALGRMTNVINALGSFVYSYVDATQRPATVFYPNGQKTLFSYFDNAGDKRLEEIKHLDPASTILSRFNYVYNAENQITNWLQELRAAAPEIWNLEYDAVDQLVRVIATTNGSTRVSYAYAYDFLGNRTLERINGVPERAAHSPLNALSSRDSSPANLVGQRVYEWDAEHRLLAVVQGDHRVEFAYDGLNRRVQIIERYNGAVTNDKHLIWCGREICEERASDLTMAKKRFYRQGTQQGNVRLWYCRDHLGSVRQLTDESGIEQARVTYDPFGRQVMQVQRASADFGFTGHYYDTPSQLNLALHRAYDPESGRWISRDPIAERGGKNLYAYVNNNPVNLVDVEGLGPFGNAPDPSDEIEGIINLLCCFLKLPCCKEAADEPPPPPSRPEICGDPPEGWRLPGTRVPEVPGDGPPIEVPDWRPPEPKPVRDPAIQLSDWLTNPTRPSPVDNLGGITSGLSGIIGNPGSVAGAPAGSPAPFFRPAWSTR